MRKPSILQDKKECFFTGVTTQLDCHHIFFGTADRKKSDENGFWVWLNHWMHIADSPYPTPHNSKEVNWYLKRLCQSRYEETHSREEFMNLMGRNYLED